MEVEVKKYLYDIQQAAQRVTKFTAGKTFDDYEQDDRDALFDLMDGRR